MDKVKKSCHKIRVFFGDKLRPGVVMMIKYFSAYHNMMEDGTSGDSYGIAFRSPEKCVAWTHSRLYTKKNLESTLSEAKTYGFLK